MVLSRNRSLVLVVSTFSLLASARTFADDELVGKQVIAIRPQLVVRLAPEPDAPPIGFSLVVPVRKVAEAKAGWLRIQEGWLQKTDVIPVDQAVKYFTSQINESPTAYSYAARSRLRLDSGEVDEAEKDAETALSLDPASCDALYAKSLLHRKAGRIADAIECYSSIIRLDPGCRGIYFLSARTLMDRKDANGVLDVVSMGLRQWPDDIDLRCIHAWWHTIRGSQRAGGGDHAGAEEDYSAAIRDWNIAYECSPSTKSKKSYALVYAARGGLRCNASRLDEAIADFGRSLELVPDDSQVWFRRGIAHGAKKDYQAATADFEKASELGLKNAIFYAAYGGSLLELGRVSEALTKLNESIRLDGQNPAAYELRGRAWVKKGECSRAIADFDKAIARWPTVAAYFVVRAAAWQELRKYDKAIEDCTSAIALDPRSASAFTFRAVSYANLKDPDKAIADCDAALKLEPENSVAYQTRGTMMELQGNHRQAIADLSRAISLNPHDLTALWNRASAWSGVGEHALAVLDIDSYLRISPQNAAAYRARAGFLTSLGKPQQAAQDLRTANRIDAQDRR